ncbi:hypothetical protein TcCL_Unassigned05261 [Trypanosoma cruzi]|nr:hypothetical protein TcCL_Unassigned05261 [Trypanosoma cruzi]
MARTNGLWEGDVHCDEKEKRLRDDHHYKTGVKLCFVHLREGGLPPGRLGGLFFFALLRSLFIPLRFLADMRREICKKFLRGVRAVVGKASYPLAKRYSISLFWAGSSCRFTATLSCGFDACVSERSGLCSQPTRMCCARRREGGCQPFYCLPAVAAAAAFLHP